MDTKKQSSFIEIVKSRFAGKGPRKDYLVIAPVSYTHLDVYKRQKEPGDQTISRFIA